MRLLGNQVTLRLGARAASLAPDGGGFRACSPALRAAPLAPLGRLPRPLRASPPRPRTRTPSTAVRGLRAFSRRLFSLLASASVHGRRAARELARKQNGNFV